MDKESHTKRPDRKALMESYGAKVEVVEYTDYCDDLLALSADAAIDHTLKIKGAYYIFGSIYGYFTIPQTIIGLEAKQQMKNLNVYPDVVIGSCGGGANLIGTAGTFLADKIEGKSDVHVISAESEHCPILTKGEMGLYSIDSREHYPLIETYGLKGLSSAEYIGGLGSTIVSSAVANFHQKGLIEAKVYNSSLASESARLFFNSEQKWVALETGYQLAAVIDYARSNSEKNILVNISEGKSDNHLYAKEKM
jgi:tryptophan synthase beta chain